MFKVGDIVRTGSKESGNLTLFKVLATSVLLGEQRIDVVVTQSDFSRNGSIYKGEAACYFSPYEKPHRGHHLTKIFQ